MINKKPLVLIMTAALLAALLLAGCRTDPAPTPTAEPPAAAEPTAAPTEPDAPAPAQPEALPSLIIGSIASETGSAATYGLPQSRGTQLAVETLNADGIWQAELVTVDDTSTNSGGLVAMERLLDGNASVILGPTLSSVAAAADPLAQAAGVPVLAVTNTTLDIMAIGDRIWRVALSDRQMIDQSLTAATEFYGLESVAVIIDETDDYAMGAGEAFVESTDLNGLFLLDRSYFDPASVDYESLLLNATADAPDALLLAARSQPATELLLAAAELGLQQILIGGNGFNSTEVLSAAGPAAEGLILTAAWNAESDLPGNAEFVATYEARWGEPPDTFAAQAYAGVQLLAEAIREGGGTEPDQIQAGLDALGLVETVVGEVTFFDGEAAYFGATQIVRDGALTLLTEETSAAAAPITIGALVSLSGSGETFGFPSLLAIELAARRLDVDRVWNSELIVFDDQSNADAAASLMQELIDFGASVIVGPTLSTVAQAADSVAQAAGIPVLAVTNTTLDIEAIGDRVWRISLNEDQLAEQAVAGAMEVYGISDAALVYDGTDDYAGSAAESLRRAAASGGLSLANRVTFDPASDDYADVLAAATSGAPGGLLLCARGDAAVELLRAAAALSLPQVKIGCNGFNAPSLFEQAGPDADGLILSAAWNIDDPRGFAGAFINDYRRTYGESPNTFSAQSYAGLQVLAEAVRAGGGSGPDEIQAGLAALGTVETVLGPLRFENREAQYEGVVQIVRYGRPVPLSAQTAAAREPASIVIGSLASQTGSAADYGLSQLQGTELAIEQIEATGLWQAELVNLDDGSTPDGADGLMQQLIDSGATAVLGPTLSSVAQVADPVAQAAGVPVLGVTNATLDIDAIGDAVWRISLSERRMIEDTIDSAMDDFGARRAVLIVDGTEAFARESAEAFRAAAAARRLQIVATFEFDPADVDYEALVEQALGEAPDTLLLADIGPSMVDLLNATYVPEWGGLRIGGNSFNLPSLPESAGDAASGLLVGGSWSYYTLNSMSDAFVDAYFERYGDMPDTFAAQAYAGVQVLAAAVVAGGGSSPEQIQAGLAALGTVETVLGALRFDGREAQYDTAVQYIDGGEFNLLDW